MYNFILQIINSLFPLPEVYKTKEFKSKESKKYLSKEDINNLRKSLKLFKF